MNTVLANGKCAVCGDYARDCGCLSESEGTTEEVLQLLQRLKGELSGRDVSLMNDAIDNIASMNGMMD
jgi:hypothetical protein